MSTIRIDKEHQEILDRLLATLVLKGKKINKKDLIGELIEDAAHKMAESEPNFSDALLPLTEDPAWIGLEKTFKLGHPTLSESVDRELYRLDGED